MDYRGILIKERERQRDQHGPVTTYQRNPEDIASQYGRAGEQAEISSEILLNMQVWKDTHTKERSGG